MRHRSREELEDDAAPKASDSSLSASQSVSLRAAPADALHRAGGGARGAVLALQGTVGNHAVQRALGATPARLIQRAVALTDADYKALAQQLRTAMEGLGTDEEGIYVALQKLQKDAAAIEKLKKVYNDTFKRDLEADLRDELSGEELRLALDLIGIKADPAAGDLVGAAPGTDAEFKAAAKKLESAMKGLGTDEEAIFAVLIPFNRDAAKLTKLKDTYKTEIGGDLETDLKDELSGSELAYALYLLNAPPAATPGSSVTVTSPGTEAHKGAVPGGDVSVHTGVDISVGGTPHTGAFTVGYEGALSEDTAVMQFLWSEVVETKSDGSTDFVAEGGLPTSNGTMELTTDPTAPKYKVDSASTSSPFYEAGGVNIRTSTGTTIHDRPYEFSDLIQRRFDAGATKVVERDHFDQFVVRDYKTIYHTSLVVEWVYTSKTSLTRTTTFGAGGEVPGMPKAFKAQLVAEYPRFEYVQ